MAIKKRFSPVLILLGALLTIAFSNSAIAQQGLSKGAEYSNRTFDRQAALQGRGETRRWLMSEQVTQGLGAPVKAQFSSAELLGIDREKGAVPERVGLIGALNATVSFEDIRISELTGRTLSRSLGAIAGTSDGGFVYTAELASPEAIGLRVHFTGFNLSEGAGVYLYAEDGQVFGPYTGRGPLGDGEFWSHTVMGDNLFLQLRQIGPATASDLRETRFTVAGLGHLRPRFLGGHCSGNNDEDIATCLENAECVNNPSVDDAKLAIASMQWISGPYIYMCSGGLVADTDTSSVRELFLSANHCISRGKDARSLENFFQLTEACGETTCDNIYQTRSTHPQELRTLGARILATGRTGDYTLFELNEQAPTGSAYLGWNSAPIAYADGAFLYRISHPLALPQAYSAHTVDSNFGECQSWPLGDWIYSHDEVGATQGGSSGSPVVNSSGKIVGQLSGGCGYNVYDSCDSGSNRTVDGALAAYFDFVAQFLDPDTGSGSCVPTTEVCDGADNDCDGSVDEGSVCEGSPPGAICLYDSDCASNKCRGKPGAKTCR